MQIRKSKEFPFLVSIHETQNNSLNSLCPSRFDRFFKHRLKDASYVSYYRNQFHCMREGLKLEDCLSVLPFKLFISQKRKITSMAVEKERQITDVIMCFLEQDILFFNYRNLILWYNVYIWYTFISYGSIIAKLFKNEVIRQYIPSNRRTGSRYRLLRAQRVKSQLTTE